VRNRTWFFSVVLISLLNTASDIEVHSLKICIISKNVDSFSNEVENRKCCCF